MLGPSPEFKEWVTIASEIATGLAAIATAIVAALALNAWQAQLHGASRHERAKAVLDEAHRVREAIVRTRDLFAGDALEQYLAWYMDLRSSIDELDVSIRRARLYWPRELDGPRQDLGEASRRYYAAIARLRMMRDNLLDPLTMNDDQVAEQNMAIHGFSDDDHGDELVGLGDKAVGEFSRILGDAAGTARPGLFARFRRK